MPGYFITESKYQVVVQKMVNTASWKSDATWHPVKAQVSHETTTVHHTVTHHTTEVHHGTSTVVHGGQHVVTQQSSTTTHSKFTLSAGSNVLNYSALMSN